MNIHNIYTPNQVSKVLGNLSRITLPFWTVWYWTMWTFHINTAQSRFTTEVTLQLVNVPNFCTRVAKKRREIGRRSLFPCIKLIVSSCNWIINEQKAKVNFDLKLESWILSFYETLQKLHKVEVWSKDMNIK